MRKEAICHHGRRHASRPSKKQVTELPRRIEYKEHIGYIENQRAPKISGKH